MNAFKNETREAWVKPQLQRLVAGSAEETGQGAPDFSTNPGPAQS